MRARPTLLPGLLWASLTLCLVPQIVHAQAFNIDFGSTASRPSGAYAAAGLAGEWNAVGELAAGVRAPLVGLDGAATDVEIYQIGGDVILIENDPSTSGEDEALIDEMYIGLNDPLDVCIWIDNLDDGEYEVLTYAITPSDPDLESRIRVDFSPEGPVMVGGAWTGVHEQNVTYARHTVEVTTGRIGLHSGLPDGFIQSGINGIQIRPITSASVGEATIETGTRFLGAWPNPASGEQRLRFRVADPSAAGRMGIYDVSGRLVWSTVLSGSSTGVQEVIWHGTDAHGVRVPAAVYFVRMGSNMQGTVLRLD